MSTGKPTYWPSDPTKIPDLLDFVIFNGISRLLLDIMDSNDLSSDHTPIIVSFNTNIEVKAIKHKVFNAKTDLNHYADYIESNINLNVPIKTKYELEDAVERNRK